MKRQFVPNAAVSALRTLVSGALSLAAVQGTRAQVTTLFPPIRLNHTLLTPGITGEYFNDPNFGIISFPSGPGLSGNGSDRPREKSVSLARPIVLPPEFTRVDETIDFDWGSESPDRRIAPDTFSVRWTGHFTPPRSGPFTFHATTDDGIRVFLNEQPIIDRFFAQPPTEHASAPILLNGGWVYDLRVDYFEMTGGAVASLMWDAPEFPKQPVRFVSGPSGANSSFGEVLASLGDGRFAASAPYAEIPGGATVGSTFQNDAGVVLIFDSAGQPSGDSRSVGPSRRRYGSAMAAFPDGKLLVGAAAFTTTSLGTEELKGSVYLHHATGAPIAAWANPDATSDPLSFFGYRLAVLSEGRFAASSGAGLGKVFLYDTNTPAAAPVTIPNPTPSPGESYGSALGPLGRDRLLVGDPGDNAVLGTAGSVMVFDLAGNRVRTIPNPVQDDLGGARFGASLLAVDDKRFLVGAPSADGTFLSGGQLLTNAIAGAVYLFDETGSLIRKFVGPDIGRSGLFGTSLAMLGTGRILIGAPSEKLGDLAVGRVHIYNLDGLLLESIDNPEPQAFDQFGASLASLDDRRFVVGAPGDDVGANNSGSVFGFDGPLPKLQLGSEIPRPNGVDAGGLFAQRGPEVSPAGAAFWHAASGKLFAVRTGAILVSWPLQLGAVDHWEASIVWPTDPAVFQMHVAGPGPVDVSDRGIYTRVTLLSTTAEAELRENGPQRLFVAPFPGDSFLMLSAGDPATSPPRFQFVRSVDWRNPANLHDNTPAVVGEPIVDPAGYHEPSLGAPLIVNESGAYCPAPVYDITTGTGIVIPVNQDDPELDRDDVVVAFLQRGMKLFDALTGAPVASSIGWPHKAVRYRARWPENPPRIIIASQLGTGPLDPAVFVDWQLYVQNDPLKPGFNPNDEHALRRPSGTGEAVYALRDDLGTPKTSEPHVLIHFADPVAKQYRMKVWRVVAEETPHVFRYAARAGELIQSPFPLGVLPLAPETAGVSGPYWRDRKLFFWARAAGDDGGSATIVMNYFYPVQPDFFFPGDTKPPVGSNIPWLDLRAGTPGKPIDVRFDTVWPSEVPELRVGESLVQSKAGLPQIAGQSSVEILYQQSLARDDKTSVRLVDPTRVRTVPLARLPAGLETRSRSGFLHFPALPPHLEGRLAYSPVERLLRFRGEFIAPPAGESYLLPNVITSRDRQILLNLSTDASWTEAIGTLANRASATMDVGSDSRGFDSLALTAGHSDGTGYLTLTTSRRPSGLVARA